MSVVKTRILNRIDIETNWNNVNPVLSSGEIAFVQTDNGTFMKVGNGSNYSDTPFFSNIKIDENIVPKLEVVHISQEDYHNLVSTNKIDNSTLYIVSSDVLNLYGEKIINVAYPEDDTDAANKKYIDELSVNLKNDIKIPTKTSELINDSDFTTTTELNKVKAVTTTLSNELKTKSSVIIDGTKSDLSVVHISKDEYHELVVNENIDNSTLYIVSSDNLNAYGEKITNVLSGEDDLDATNVAQVKSYINDLKIDIDENINILNEFVEKKVCIDGQYSDLSILRVNSDEYHNLVANNQVNNDILYIVSSENINAYGERIENVADGEISSDGVNLGQVSSLIDIEKNRAIDSETSILEILSETENELKTSIDNKVLVDGLSANNLEVKHISQDDYHALVKDNNVLSNIIYVVSSDEMNMYNERIINVADAISSNDAVNLNQLCSAISSIDIPEIPKNISEFENDSQYAKISVDGNSTTEFNVEHISQDDYHDLVVNEKIDSNKLYIVSSDAINAYGEKIINLADGSSANDAATYGQLSNLQHIHETTITDIQVIKPEFKHSNVHISLSAFEDSKLNDFVINVDSALSSQYFSGYYNDGETQSWESNPTGFGVEYDNHPVLISLTNILKDNGLENKYSKLFLLYEWYYSDGSSRHASDRYSVVVPSYTEVGANASDYVTKTQHDELQMEISKPSYGAVKMDDMFVCQSNKTNNITDILNGTVQILLEDFSFDRQYDIKFTTGDEDVTFEFNIDDPVNGPEYDENWNINKNYIFEANKSFLIKIRQDFIEVIENQYLGGSISGNLSYKLVTAQPIDVNSTIFNIENRTITTITLSDSDKDITINLPEKQDGYARDFILRIEVTSATAPQIGFNGLDEEWLVDSEDEEWMIVKPGTNVISFTEMIQGK